MSIQVYYTSNRGSLRSFRGCYGPKIYTYSIFHDFIEFCDPENIGIDMSLDVVCAIVFVLWRFTYFRVMATIIGPPGGQNVQKSLVLDFSIIQHLNTFQMSLIRSLQSNFYFSPIRPMGDPAAILKKGAWRKMLNDTKLVSGLILIGTI